MKKFIYDNDVFEKVDAEGKKFRLTFIQDVDSNNDPRNWDDTSHLICWHRRYELGDKHNYKSPEDFFVTMLEQLGYSQAEIETFIEPRDEDKSRMAAFDRCLDMISRQDVAICKLYLYDHSGICMSISDFNDPWDSGVVGFGYITKEEYRKRVGTIDELHWKDAALECIVDEVKLYSQYLEGDVYGFKVDEVSVCPCCGKESISTVDSIWGFFGNDITDNGMLDSIPDLFKDLFEEDK